MLKIRRLSILALGLVLLLAACGQPTPEVQPTPDGFVKLSIGLDSSSLSTQGITTLGSPYNPNDGTIATNEVQVSVYDKNNVLVKFNLSGSTYTAAAGGSLDHITLNVGTPTANIALLAGGNPYTFTSLGYDGDTSTPHIIAYDSQTRSVATNTTVTVTLTSVLAGAVLTPRFPTTVATPGATLDLMLVVMANGHATFSSDYLQVPLGDFSVLYGPVSGAALVNSSNRGIRVTVNSDCTTQVTVQGDVTGLNTSYDPSATFDINGSSGYSLACPAAVGGQIEVDLEPPSVSLTSYDSSNGAVVGTASDNWAIDKVQVFDGPVLLASTDSNEGVAPITFVPTTNQFNATLATPYPAGGITVVAFDTSGNEAHTAESLNPNFVYVDAGNTSGTEDGSQAHPFNTIQEGIDAAAAGGTVYVLDGTYSGNLTINKALTLAGESTASTVIKGTLLADNSLSSTGSYVDFVNKVDDDDGNADRTFTPTSELGITVTASNVTLQNLTVKDFYYGVRFSGSSLQNVAMSNVNVSGAWVAVDVPTTTSIDGFTMTNGVISDSIHGLYVGASSSTPSDFTNVLITSTQFIHNTAKGLYIEKLSDATFDSIVVRDSGNFGRQPFSGGDVGGYGNGIDINLKFGNYSNITLTNIDVQDSGRSNQEGAGTPHALGGAVVIKARDDGTTYGANPATLTNVILDGTVISTEPVGDTTGTTGTTALRFGEPGKDNAGPTGVVVKNMTLIGEVALDNATQATIDADEGNTFYGTVDQTGTGGSIDTTP